eukprot:scaffold144234_cov35-Tisochrysis_lutea.AAC.1
MPVVFREQLLDELEQAADREESLLDVMDALATTSLVPRRIHQPVLGDFFPPDVVTTDGEPKGASAGHHSSLVMSTPKPQRDSEFHGTPTACAMPVESERALEQHAWQFAAWLGPVSTLAAVGSCSFEDGSTTDIVQSSYKATACRERLPRGLSSALRTQEHAVAQYKFQGRRRRAIGKHSRNEVHERRRRLEPLAICGAAEAAARRGREAEADISLAHMVNNTLSLKTSDAMKACSLMASDRANARVLSSGKTSRQLTRARGHTSIGVGDKKRSWRVVH